MLHNQYTPLWPRTGPKQHVATVLSGSLEGTIDALYRQFPSLATIATDRLSLKTYEEQDCSPGFWVTVTEEVWDSVMSKPPSRLMVGVEDLPGEAHQRECMGIGCHLRLCGV